MKKKVVYIILFFMIVAFTGLFFISDAAQDAAQSGKMLFCTRCVCPGEAEYKNYYCDSSNPYFSYCDCKCYANKNYDTSKPGGCNVWADCKDE